MPGLKEIAEKAGVSIETVSRILSGRYKGKTQKSIRRKEEVERIAREENYKPHTGARAMRTKKNGLVGVIIDEHTLISHTAITEILKGINLALEERGYITTFTTLPDISENSLNSRVFKEKLLDGIILIDNIREKQVERIRSTISPCVLVNNNKWEDKLCVRRDEYAAGFAAGKELASLGYKRALYFDTKQAAGMDPKEQHYSVDDRFFGFENGFSAPGQSIMRVRTTGENVKKNLLERYEEIDQQTVIVASQNFRLYRLHSVLSQMPLCPGKNFGLACIDDEYGLNFSWPELSKVSFDRGKIGRIAAEMMVNYLEGNEDKCKSLHIKGEWAGGQTTPQLKKDKKESG